MPGTEFTPVASLAGGALIGLAAVMMMAFHGRIAGISGIAGRLLPPYRDGDMREPIAFVAGLAAAPLILIWATGRQIAQDVSESWVLLAAAGLLVGFGSTMGRGCTSGHGVCGLARLSPRSLVATLTFMAVAIVTVFVTRHVLGR
jgi:uncharacterized membrane protein YedE/YeeE